MAPNEFNPHGRRRRSRSTRVRYKLRVFRPFLVLAAILFLSSGIVGLVEYQEFREGQARRAQLAPPAFVVTPGSCPPPAITTSTHTVLREIPPTGGA